MSLIYVAVWNVQVPAYTIQIPAGLISVMVTHNQQRGQMNSLKQTRSILRFIFKLRGKVFLCFSFN